MTSTNELYQSIVAAERPCPGVPNELGEGYQGGGRVCVNGRSIAGDESDMGQCDVCDGSGKVAVLPLLRETCEVGGFYHYVRGGEAYHNAEGCPGWQAKPMSAELLWDAMARAGFLWRVRTFRDGDANVYAGAEVFTRDLTGLRRGESLHKQSPLEALISALAQLIGVEV